MLLKKKNKSKTTIEAAFDLLIEYYSIEREEGTNKWLREIKNEKPMRRRMFYHLQRYIRENEIDLKIEDKEKIVNAFHIIWKDKTCAPLRV